MQSLFRFCLPLCFFFQALFLYAQPPAGYYSGTDGLTGTALQARLYNIIKNHNAVTYSSIYTHFQLTDKKPNNTVWDMYSDIPAGTPPYIYHFNSDECGNYNSEGDCFNREHSWPSSWFNDQMPMRTDLFHIYPTDGYVNNKRANFPFGIVGAATWVSMNGSRVGNCSYPGCSGTVFEPIDEYKGDFARTYFYMATRYYGEDGGWVSNAMVTGSQLKAWAADMLIEWHQNDPVSQKETNRNNAVYQIQNNRNPFIDHPIFADRIWGDATAVGNPDAPATRVYPNPFTKNLMIEIPVSGMHQNGLIRVYDVSMRQVWQSESGLSGETVLDLGFLAPGLYFIVPDGFPGVKVLKN